MEQYKKVNGKNLRCGYTTGTCACGAAKAAVYMLFSKESLSEITVETPSGAFITMALHNVCFDEAKASCSIVKDGGDDPDVTSGMHIFVKAEKFEETGEVVITGGEGIGMVTKPGLDQPVGQYAINSTPRKFITENVKALMKNFDYQGGIKITVSAPEGVEIAKKTFNPRMGIEGGISIIGTTGIVEPMSNEAIVQTTKLEIAQRKALGKEILYITPGRIGESFAYDTFGINPEDCVLCSNNIGEAFDDAMEAGFKNIYLIGHIGKLVKLSYGARNTHSANNDGRIEQMILAALKSGATNDVLASIAECVTTDGAIAILKENELLEGTMDVLGERILGTLVRWTGGYVNLNLCVFTNMNKEPLVLIQKEYSC